MRWSCGFQLRVRAGPNRGQTIVIDAPVLKVGRAIRPGERVPGWVRLSDDTVSRLHCEIFWQEDRGCFRLLHRSTTNSTYVNGEVVEDIEIFDGDILEMGATSLELQKADLRWSRAETNEVEQWASVASPLAIEETKPMTGVQRIPGATIPAAKAPSNRRLTFTHVLVHQDGHEYELKGNRVRFGSNQPPEQPQTGPDESPPPLPKFDAEYEFTDQNFSYYNLVLAYDELVQSYKAVRVGPQARKVRIMRKQSGLVWHSELPEGGEVSLLEGDCLQAGELFLTYQKKG